MSEGERISAVISVRNEEGQLADCLETLRFADEIVVLLDKCTDRSEEIARRFTQNIHHGDWPTEGQRRNAGIAQANGAWVFEIDADERVTPELAREIRETVNATTADWHEIPVDNYVGSRLVRHGWGASFGKAAYPGLFRKGVKVWGDQRVHPSLKWTGRKGAMLKGRIEHYVDRDLADMLKRLNSYSTARAKDLIESGDIGSTANNLRRFFSRFFKCYVARKGYREGGYGLAIAVCAGLYPLFAHLKARCDLEAKRERP
jgi:glycosyltransferase involved in cell wall biosynthesis